MGDPTIRFNILPSAINIVHPRCGYTFNQRTKCIHSTVIHTTTVSGVCYWLISDSGQRGPQQQQLHWTESQPLRPSQNSPSSAQLLGWSHSSGPCNTRQTCSRIKTNLLIESISITPAVPLHSSWCLCSCSGLPEPNTRQISPSGDVHCESTKNFQYHRCSLWSILVISCAMIYADQPSYMDIFLRPLSVWYAQQLYPMAVSGSRTSSTLISKYFSSIPMCYIRHELDNV